MALEDILMIRVSECIWYMSLYFRLLISSLQHMEIIQVGLIITGLQNEKEEGWSQKKV